MIFTSHVFKTDKYDIQSDQWVVLSDKPDLSVKYTHFQGCRVFGQVHIINLEMRGFQGDLCVNSIYNQPQTTRP